MLVDVCIHKYIRNGCIKTVTCTCIQALFVAVRNNQMDHKSFVYERAVNIAFSFMKRTSKTREHSDGINDKLQNCNLPLTNKRFICYSLSLYLCLQYFRTRLSWGYLKVTCVWVTLYHRETDILILFLWLALSNNWKFPRK
jgi:hypothetical protein